MPPLTKLSINKCFNCLNKSFYHEKVWGKELVGASKLSYQIMSISMSKRTDMRSDIIVESGICL